jgi:hypothetical protein
VRDVRYFAERVASAIPQPKPADTGLAAFGSKVTILRDDGRRQTFRIVGEDEADPRADPSPMCPLLPVGSSESASVRPWRWTRARLRLSRSNRAFAAAAENRALMDVE